MISTSFAEQWSIKERKLGFAAAELVSCGDWLLPRDAAPCLSFDEASVQPRLWEVFGALSDWSDADRARLATYRMIGSDGAGNPLCIDETSGSVWMLDHEDRFRTHQFVNSNIQKLAYSLLAYMGEEDSERFLQQVREIDPAAAAKDSFWSGEAAVMADE